MRMFPGRLAAKAGFWFCLGLAACAHGDHAGSKVDPDRAHLYGSGSARLEKSEVDDLSEGYDPGELAAEKVDRRIELHPDEARTITRVCLARNPRLLPAELRGQCYQRECTNGRPNEACREQGDPRILAVAEAQYGKDFVESRRASAEHGRDTAKLRKACLKGELAACELWRDHIRGGDFDAEVERFRAEICRSPAYACVRKRVKAGDDVPREMTDDCALLNDARVLSCERLDVDVYERIDVRRKRED